MGCLSPVEKTRGRTNSTCCQFALYIFVYNPQDWQQNYTTPASVACTWRNTLHWLTILSHLTTKPHLNTVMGQHMRFEMVFFIYLFFSPSNGFMSNRLVSSPGYFWLMYIFPISAIELFALSKSPVGLMVASQTRNDWRQRSRNLIQCSTQILLQLRCLLLSINIIFLSKNSLWQTHPFADPSSEQLNSASD